MMFTQRLVIVLLLSAAFIALDCQASDRVSPSRHRRRLSEGTFVRGMMAADHQFGLYMAVSETSRGGGSDHDENENVKTQVVSRGRSGPAMHVHHVMDQARGAAVILVDAVRRREFSPVQFRPKAR